MNIIMTRRIMRINELVVTLGQISEQGKEINIKGMIEEVCIRHGCSAKTAREYLNIAMLKFDRQKDVDKQEEEGEQIRVTDSESISS